MTFRNFRARQFKKFGNRSKRFQVLMPFVGTMEGVDTVLTDLIRDIGDEKVAKRVRKLQQEFPFGTIPELVVMDWLQYNKHRYIYQGMLYGGRARAGGLLPDFVVDTGGADGAAWQVQGAYWHAKDASKKYSDAANNLRLLGQVVGGIRIGRVIEMWDFDILHRRNQVLRMAMAGISLR